jgi:hypothetical protein
MLMAKHQQHTTKRRKTLPKAELIVKIITALAALTAALAELIKALS